MDNMEKEYSLRKNTWQIFDKDQKAWIDVSDTSSLVSIYEALLDAREINKDEIKVQGCRFTEDQNGSYRGFINFIDEKGWNKITL